MSVKAPIDGAKVERRGKVPRRTRRTSAQRAGWSTNQAASFCGLVPRTLLNWRLGEFFVPSAVPVREIGLEGQVMYGLPDLLGARVAKDLLDACVELAIVKKFAAEVSGQTDANPETIIDVRKVAKLSWWVMAPTTTEALETQREIIREFNNGSLKHRDGGESMVTVYDSPANAMGEDTYPSDNLVRWKDLGDWERFCFFYPVSIAAIELVKLVDEWRVQTGFALHTSAAPEHRKLAPWM